MENQFVQGFGVLKIPVSTYFLPPDDMEALEYLKSILNHHTIHNVIKSDDPYKLNLLNFKNEVIAELKMHDIDIEWDMVYYEN